MVIIFDNNNSKKKFGTAADNWAKDMFIYR